TYHGRTGWKIDWERPVRRLCGSIQNVMDPLELSPEAFRRLAANVAELAADYISTLERSPYFSCNHGRGNRALVCAGVAGAGDGRPGLGCARGRDRSFAGAQRTL